MSMVPPGASDNTNGDVLMKETRRPREGGAMTKTAVALLLAGSVLAIGPCDTPTGAKDRVLAGTWGGDNAGVIVTDTSAHVHIGCTVGDVHQPLETDPERRFDVPGLYNITAYPVYRGPDHPARFTGRIDSNVTTLTAQRTASAVLLARVRVL